MVQLGQNSPEVIFRMSSIVMKMLTISPFFWTTESSYFWCHRVGSMAYFMCCWSWGGSKL